MTVKEQYEFLLKLAGEERTAGNEYRARQLLACARSLQDLWLDMKADLTTEYINEEIATVGKGKKSVHSGYKPHNRNNGIF